MPLAPIERTLLIFKEDFEHYPGPRSGQAARDPVQIIQSRYICVKQPISGPNSGQLCYVRISQMKEHSLSILSLLKSSSKLSSRARYGPASGADSGLSNHSTPGSCSSSNENHSRLQKQQPCRKHLGNLRRWARKFPAEPRAIQQGVSTGFGPMTALAAWVVLAARQCNSRGGATPLLAAGEARRPSN